MELSSPILSLINISMVFTNDNETVYRDKEELKKETEKLVNAFCGGERQAFNRLVLLYQNKIYNLAFNYVKNQEEAKDLTQDVFITAHRALPNLREHNKFSSWLYQIALNHCRNRYKKLKRQGYFTSQSLDSSEIPLQLSVTDSPEKSLERQQLIAMVRTTIAQMNETEKEIILLRDIQGLSYEEISKILSVPLGTVKSKLNRARIALKDRLLSVRENL
jgi:RNA polymerase sigma-70 factor (ECF subfamily)